MIIYLLEPSDDFTSILLDFGFVWVPSSLIQTISSNVVFNGTKIFNHNLKGRYGPPNDHTHFDKVSQIEFGKRYFYKYNNDSLLNITTGGRRKNKPRKNRTKKDHINK